MKVNKRVKQWLAILLVGLFTFLFVVQAIPIGMNKGSLDVEASGKYDNSELTSVLPSAYYETNNSLTSDGDNYNDNTKRFETNVREISGEHFGNVGLFVGFPGDSDAQLTALNTSNALSISDSNNQFRSSDVRRYYSFGAAIQNLSDKGLKSSKIEETSQKSVEGISNAAKSLTKAGARLVKDYDPTPLIMSMYLTEGSNNNNAWVSGMPKHINLANEADNKLVQIVMKSESLMSMLDIVRISPTGKGSMTLFSWIVFIMVIMLIAGGVMMQVFNGRAAGENYRKAIVKIVISTLAVPLIATLLHYGVTTFVDVAEPDITPQEDYMEKAIGQHLNFADWYATGFAVPDGLALKIRNERFVLSEEQIRQINKYTYNVIVGNPDYSAAGDVDTEMVYRRLMNAGDKNASQPSFIEKSGWDGMTVKKLGDDIVKNDEDAEMDLGWLETTRGSYLKGFRNQMSDPNSDGDSIVSVTDNKGSGESARYGMSPLAAYNMMRSTFSGGNINSSLSKPDMASVVYTAAVGSASKRMNGLTRLVATYAMVMAAMKGLALIFASGLGGVFGGAVSGGLGNSAGLGQAIGGVIALIGGVVGMGLIMNLSFMFLEELHNIFFDIFKGTVMGDPTMLDPLKDMVDDLPRLFNYFKPFLKGALETLSTALITIASMIALPKFGKIPINLFSQKMSELPNNFSEKAQRMENRFTGDYRAGATGGGGGMSSSLNSQVSQVAAETSSQIDGLREAGAGVGGMIMGAAGGKLINFADNMLGDNKEGDLSLADKNEEHNEDDEVKTEIDGVESINEADQLEADHAQNLTSITGEELGPDGQPVDTIEGGDKESLKDTTKQKDTKAKESDSLTTGLGAKEVEGQMNMFDGDNQIKEETDASQLDASKQEEVNSDNLTNFDSEGNAISKEDSIRGPEISKEDSITGPEISKEDSITGPEISKEDSITGPEISKEDSITGPEISKEDSITGPETAINSEISSKVDRDGNVIGGSSINSEGAVTGGTSIDSSGQFAGNDVQSVNQASNQGVESIDKGTSPDVGVDQNVQYSRPVSDVSTKGGDVEKPKAEAKGGSGVKSTKAVSDNLKNGTPTMTKKQDTPTSNTANKAETSKGQTNTGDGEKAKSKPTPSLVRNLTSKGLRTVGEGMKAAGGETDINRVMKTAKHARTSVLSGGAAQQKSQAELNDAQGKVNVVRPNPKEPNASQPAQPARRSNKRKDGRILRQEEEQERRQEEANKSKK